MDEIDLELDSAPEVPEILSQGDISPAAGEEEDRGLALVDNSIRLIRTVFLGIAMQYRALLLQRSLILCPETADGTTGPEAISPREIQAAASLIILCALLGFQNQAKEVACQTAQAGSCPDTTDIQLGSIVILVAIIRLLRLAAPEKEAAANGQAADSPQELENADDILG